LDREIELYPVVHCWRTDRGAQLTFWCRWCNKFHWHGRHLGDAYVRCEGAENELSSTAGSPVSDRMWLAHLNEYASCTFNDRVCGGRGICTCPTGSGDGHRVAHCHNAKSGYYDHGYILHEVEPNDVRALTKPPRKTRQRAETN
jgi:hypothetical protein